MSTQAIRTETTRLREEPEPLPEPKAHRRRDDPPAIEDGVDPVVQEAHSDLFDPRPVGKPASSTLLSEDASDSQVNCLDLAVDVVKGLSPAERQNAELVILEDNRPGAEGRTGHVVVRQGDQVIDPTTGRRFASTDEYLKANPQYREAGTLAADQAARIFETPAGSPERVRALAQADVPPALANMLLADVDGTAKTIQKELAGDWYRLGNVRTDDLQKINGLLEGVTPQERNAIVGKLSKEELAKWADELGGAVGGLSGEEKRKMFDMLAGSLDRDQMARFTEAVGKNAPEALKELTQAAMQHLSMDDKVAYMKTVIAHAPGESETVVKEIPDADKEQIFTRLATELEPADMARFTKGLGASGGQFNQYVIDHATNDDKVKYILEMQPDPPRTTSEPFRAEALASLKDDPAAFAEAIRGLDARGQLRSMMTNSLREGAHDAVAHVLDAATKVNDLDLKMKVLNEASGALRDADLSLEQSTKLGSLGVAFRELLLANPEHTGPILQKLRETDARGETMIEVFKTLLGTDPPDPDSAKKLFAGAKATGPQADANLGYLFGGLLVAAEGLKDDIDKQKTEEARDRTNVIVALGLTVGLVPVVGDIVVAALSLGSQRAGEIDNGATEKEGVDSSRVTIEQSADFQRSDELRTWYYGVLDAHGKRHKAGIAP